VVNVRDDGNVTNLIHSALMSVGQPASVDRKHQGHRGDRSPHNLARGICRNLSWRQAAAERSRSGRYPSGRRKAISALLGWCVMAVDPDPVMMMPRPMPRNPNPINATDVVPWPVYIIRPVTDFHVYNDSICHGCHRCQHCQKYSNFSLHTRNSILD